MDDLPSDPKVLQDRLTKAREEFRKLNNKVASLSVASQLADAVLNQLVQIMGGSCPEMLIDHPAVRMALDHTLVGSQAATHRLQAEHRLELIRQCEVVLAATSDFEGQPEGIERLLWTLRSELAEEDRERVHKTVSDDRPAAPRTIADDRRPARHA